MCFFARGLFVGLRRRKVAINPYSTFIVRDLRSLSGVPELKPLRANFLPVWSNRANLAFRLDPLVLRKQGQLRGFDLASVRRIHFRVAGVVHSRILASEPSLDPARLEDHRL